MSFVLATRLITIRMSIFGAFLRRFTFTLLKIRCVFLLLLLSICMSFCFVSIFLVIFTSFELKYCTLWSLLLLIYNLIFCGNFPLRFWSLWYFRSIYLYLLLNFLTFLASDYIYVTLLLSWRCIYIFRKNDFFQLVFWKFIQTILIFVMVNFQNIPNHFWMLPSDRIVLTYRWCRLFSIPHLSLISRSLPLKIWFIISSSDASMITLSIIIFFVLLLRWFLILFAIAICFFI